MAENSKIEWTDHTLNLWWGCTKVHTGCKNCYAETLSKRWGNDIWGEDKSRKRIVSAFPDLKKYQNQSVKENKLVKVFCGSMMDIFEDDKSLSNPTRHNEGWEIAHTSTLRHKLFEEIGQGKYDNLIFLFLTKRPWNIPHGNAPKNVWFGTSISNQVTADVHIEHLRNKKLNYNLFLSIEPLVGPINSLNLDGIKWVIVGGESGRKARPMHPDWVRSIRDQCKTANVPFFFKQWGEWEQVGECGNCEDSKYYNAKNCTRLNIHGDMGYHGEKAIYMMKTGKSETGNELDGIHHKEFPNFE